MKISADTFKLSKEVKTILTFFVIYFFLSWILTWVYYVTHLKFIPVEWETWHELIKQGSLGDSNQFSLLSFWAVDIVSKLDAIMEKYSPTVMCLENYLFLVSKNKQGDSNNTTKYRRGLFAIPSLLGVLKYHWYLRTNEEPIMIYAATWKAALCGKAYANKEEVRFSLNAHLPKKVVQDIRDEYSDKKGKGEQDCLDAIAMNLYVCKRIDLNRKIEDTKLK